MNSAASGTLLYRRKLKLKTKFESGSSHFSFKRWNQARFQHGFWYYHPAPPYFVPPLEEHGQLMRHLALSLLFGHVPRLERDEAWQVPPKLVAMTSIWPATHLLVQVLQPATFDVPYRRGVKSH
jgi:hypothetical protein